MTTFAFVAEGFDGSWQKIPHAGFQMKSTSNVEEPKGVKRKFTSTRKRM
jgi:hypothetical protein